MDASGLRPRLTDNEWFLWNNDPSWRPEATPGPWALPGFYEQLFPEFTPVGRWSGVYAYDKAGDPLIRRSWVEGHLRTGRGQNDMFKAADSVVVGYDQSGSDRFTTNCHGYTFLDGKYWLSPEELNKYLLLEGWTEVPSGQHSKVGDVAVYSDPTDLQFHSAAVMMGGPDPIVSGKSGINPPSGFQPLRDEVPWNEGFTSVKFYRPK